MNSKIKFVATLLTALMSSAVFAQGASRYQTPATGLAKNLPHLSLLAGVADTEDRDSSANYGIEVGIRPILPLTSSIELSGNVGGKQEGRATITRTKLLAKANYNVGGDIPLIRDTYIGAGLGPVLDNNRHDQDVELGVAPQVGFNIPVTGTQVSVGANANYMFVSGDKPDVFALNGVATFWY